MNGAPPEGDVPRVLDLTAEATNPNQAAPTVKTLEERREDTRRAVAILLLMGLGIIVTGWTAVGVWGDAEAVTAGGDALRTAFTGLLGLTGTVVGFYFGGSSKNT